MVALPGIGILVLSWATMDKGMETGAEATVATLDALFTAILAFALLKEGLSIHQ